MRFLFYTKPPKERLIRSDDFDTESSRLRHQRPTESKDLPWTKRQILLAILVITLLFVLFILFSWDIHHVFR